MSTNLPSPPGSLPPDRPAPPGPPAPPGLHPRSRAWVEVDASALRRNLARIAETVGPQTALVPMVKADAYGLGALRAVEALADFQPWAWGVATVAEGVALREAGVERPIHIYSPLAPDELHTAVAAHLTPTLSLPQELDSLAGLRAPGRIPFQVEIDTGMGRAGAPEATWRAWRSALDRRPTHLEWTGLFMHFHSADEPGGPGMAEQVGRFAAALDQLAPPASVRVHLANSAAALRGLPAAPSHIAATHAPHAPPHTTPPTPNVPHATPTPMPLGAARAGIFMYGGRLAPDLPAPEPVVHVRARITRIVDVPPGATCGYGATYSAAGPERWATLAIGYGDGFPRALGNRAHVLIAGQRAPIIGRISMDVTVANISGLAGVTPGMVATLIGTDGDAHIPLDEVAAHAGTIPYEVLTRLSPRLPRIWLTSENVAASGAKT